MPQTSSPPIAVADATPWTWVGQAEALSYQVRFYATEPALDELAQTGGDRTVSITVNDRLYYPDLDLFGDHTSTIENAPPTLVHGGQWKILRLGLGEKRVVFSAAQAGDPAGSTHYRIVVKT